VWLLKLLIVTVLAAIVLIFLWIHRERIRQWWESLFSRTPTAEIESLVNEQQEPGIALRAFSSFRNPIGRESDLRRVVVVTFQAFEAWAREQGTNRHKDETPTEFLQRVVRVAPQANPSGAQIVEAYNRIVYGKGGATEKDLKAAEQMWRIMQAS
jgi:hypothetical protein